MARERLRMMSRLEQATESALVCRWLRPRLRAGLILAFAPLPDEVSLWPLLESIAARGQLALPRVDGSRLSLFRVPHLTSLRAGPFRLLEPGPGALPVSAAEVGVALVPGLAFTRTGARLGRGKGFYDRLLALLPATTPRIGVCYACQIVDSLPLEEHDMPVDEVVPVWDGEALAAG